MSETELPAWRQSQTPPNVQRSVYAVGPHQMSALEKGAGFPVVLVHGHPTWSYLWRKCLLVGRDWGGSAILDVNSRRETL